MLFRTPSLTAEDRRVLAEIDAFRADLRHRVTVPARWTAGLRRFLTADAVASSNSIEGFKVATVDVQDLIDGERDVDVSDENRRETIAYQQTMTYVQSLHDVRDFAYSKELLNALHWMLQGHRHARSRVAGQWRRAAGYVIDPEDPRIAAYTAPDADEVPGLMSELVDWLNTDDGSPALIRAAMAHLHLVSIHPWPDGNGRMSRSLQTLVIAREGILAPEFSSIEAWLGRPRHTWEYYRVLRERGATYRPDGDASSWIRFNLTAYHQHAQTVRGQVRTAARVWEMLAAFAADRGLAERTVSALYEVATTGRLRRSRYEAAEGLGTQAAQRDLRDLRSARLLEPVGRTRARYYVAGDAFPADALEEARRPFTLTEPYAD